ncbi:hypothetical protein [Flavisericum labens]|uniref:hypothetical protein n=1 Tax=Flavisericum labens TaxID=3377112 RepID=UPI00387B1BAE
MRTIPSLLFSIFVLLTGCKNTEENGTVSKEEQNKSETITEEDIAKLKFTDYVLDVKAQNIIKTSVEYVQLQDLRNNIKNGDLSFFVGSEETSKALFKNLRQTLPSEFNTESILARILVLETEFYKLESLSRLTTTSREELLQAIKDFFVAYSNLSLQINKKMEFENRTIEKP